MGCLVYAPEFGHLHFVKARRLERAASLFPWSDIQTLRSVFLPHVVEQTRILGAALAAPGQFPFEPAPKYLGELSTQIIPHNDNALQWREEQVMRRPDLAWIIDYLVVALFDKHRKEEATAPSDEEVWAKQFRPGLHAEVARFDEDYSIEVGERSFHFDYARQTGVCTSSTRLPSRWPIATTAPRSWTDATESTPRWPGRIRIDSPSSTCPLPSRKTARCPA